jgi:flagellar biosynthetic protein FliR
VIHITLAQLNLWIAAFFWPFFRILALVASSPLFGARGIPGSVKIGMTLALTVMVAPILPPMPNVPPASAQGLFILVDQLMIGVAMGLAIRIVISAVEMAGHIMGLQMGLGFATFFDPQNSTQIPVVGQFLGLVAMLLFLAINGHLMVISVLVDSFSILPVSLYPLASGAWKTLVLWGGEVFRGGVLISMPVVAALMMTNIALAVLNRAAPALNIFTVGFPLTLAIGFIMIALGISHFQPVFTDMLDDGLRTMQRIAADAKTPAAF